jgi:copper chaperone CopZ
MKSTSHSLTPEQRGSVLECAGPPALSDVARPAKASEGWSTPGRCRAFVCIWLVLVCQSFAADPVQKYEGEVAGIFCSACSSHVKAALLTIDGVQSVKITTADKGGLPKLLITSTKPLTREAAIQALGEKAKMYHIQSLKPVTP